MKKTFAPLLALAFATTAFAADKAVQFSELPPAVQKTMQQQVASTGAKINKTLVEVENGKKNYECESILANGKKQDFDVDPEGKLGEIEDEIQPSDVPAPVKAKIDKALANGGKLKELVSITLEGKITGYEASITTNGKTKGFEMNPDGTAKKD